MLLKQRYNKKLSLSLGSFFSSFPYVNWEDIDLLSQSFCVHRQATLACPHPPCGYFNGSGKAAFALGVIRMRICITATIPETEPDSFTHNSSECKRVKRDLAKRAQDNSDNLFVPTVEQRYRFRGRLRPTGGQKKNSRVLILQPVPGFLHASVLLSGVFHIFK